MIVYLMRVQGNSLQIFKEPELTHKGTLFFGAALSYKINFAEQSMAGIKL